MTLKQHIKNKRAEERQAESFIIPVYYRIEGDKKIFDREAMLEELSNSIDFLEEEEQKMKQNKKQLEDKKMNKKYAIVDNQTKEFYADPIYKDIKDIKKKIEYLKNYRLEHNMDYCDYVIEELTEEREKQHNEEWQRFLNLID